MIVGSVFVCKDKKKINKLKLEKHINKSLKNNFYINGREWPYKIVKAKIIIEKYIEDKNSKELTDYKFYCFNGKCEYVMTCIDRMKGKTKFFYFDKNWNLKKEFSKDGIKYGDSIKIEKPKNLNEMFKIAEILSKGFKFIRVDLYEANEKILFGELTFFPSSGFDNTRTKECEEYLDKSLIIDKSLKDDYKN